MPKSIKKLEKELAKQERIEAERLAKVAKKQKRKELQSKIRRLKAGKIIRAGQATRKGFEKTGRGIIKTAQAARRGAEHTKRGLDTAGQALQRVEQSGILGQGMQLPQQQPQQPQTPREKIQKTRRRAKNIDEKFSKLIGNL